MMTGVTPQGFITKTQQQVLQELTEELEQEFGKDFPTSPDSVIGQYNNIIAAAIKEVWDLGQAVADTQKRSTAEGVYLDYLARLIGLSRRRASGSTGKLHWYGVPNTIIPAFSVAKDNLERKVITQQEINLTPTSCYTSLVSVDAVVENYPYSVNIGSNKYTYTSSSPTSENDILEGLRNQVSSDPTLSAVIQDEGLLITNNLVSNSLVVTTSGNLVISSVGSVVESEAAEVGALSFPENTIIGVVSDLPDVEVNNPEDFDLGRFRETDQELRKRMADREENTGTATVPAIEASISQILGVTDVIVIENEKDYEVDGLPPKSYETFVVGGDEDRIANVIYETKPAGIETVGDIQKTIVDSNGELQSVYFSRKENLFAWIRITYSINPEEEIPAAPEDAMTNAVVSYGNDMGKDEDYLNNKFFGPIYSEVDGVYVDQIEIAVTSQETDLPTYQTARIPVDDTQNLVFSADRVEFL